MQPNELEKEYHDLSAKFKEEWASLTENMESIKTIIVKMVGVLREIHPDWSIRRIIYKIAADHNGLKGFNRTTIWQQLPEDMKDKQKHRRKALILKTGSTPALDGPRRLVDQQDLDMANQKIQSLEIERRKDTQTIFTLKDQLARAQTMLKRAQNDLQKAEQRGEFEQDEIEIIIPRYRPDGSILYRDMLAAMAKKLSVFYLVAIPQKRGGKIAATALDVRI
jgi:hypothetical protein